MGRSVMLSLSRAFRWLHLWIEERVEHRAEEQISRSINRLRAAARLRNSAGSRSFTRRNQ